MDNEMKKLLEKRWAVVGFNYERAKEIIEKIVASCGKEVSRKMISKSQFRVEFADGTTLQHIRASESARGNKIGKMWCDKDIDRDVLYRVIMPMYFGERDDIVWL